MDIRTVVGFKNSLVGRTFETRRRKATFRFIDVDDHGVIVRPQSAKKDRPIPVNQVNSMGAQWDDYKSGKVTRTEVAKGSPKNFNTSYLEVIFQEIERQKTTSAI